MPTAQYTPLANITLGASASSVSFSNINQGYKDLFLVTYLVSAGTYASASMRINSDTGSNYSSIWVGDGTVFSGNATAQGFFWSGWASGGNITNVTHIMDYAATDKHKVTLSRVNKLDSESISTGFVAHRWASTSAITNFSVYSTGTYGNPFAAGTTFALYGVK